MSEQKIPIPAMLYNAAVGGHVTNSQQIIDEDYNLEQKDINKETLGVPYNASNPNGMGKIVLKKNDNFKEVIEAQTNGNTIFVIKYDFTLTDNVTIPANCVLQFDGGSISGAYAINGNNTKIDASPYNIFKGNISIQGSWVAIDYLCEWFGGDVEKCINTFGAISLIQNTIIYNPISITKFAIIKLKCEHAITVANTFEGEYLFTATCAEVDNVNGFPNPILAFEGPGRIDLNNRTCFMKVNSAQYSSQLQLRDITVVNAINPNYRVPDISEGRKVAILWTDMNASIQGCTFAVDIREYNFSQATPDYGIHFGTTDNKVVNIYVIMGGFGSIGLHNCIGNSTFDTVHVWGTPTISFHTDFSCTFDNCYSDWGKVAYYFVYNNYDMRSISITNHHYIGPNQASNSGHCMLKFPWPDHGTTGIVTTSSIGDSGNYILMGYGDIDGSTTEWFNPNIEIKGIFPKFGNIELENFGSVIRNTIKIPANKTMLFLTNYTSDTMFYLTLWWRKSDKRFASIILRNNFVYIDSEEFIYGSNGSSFYYNGTNLYLRNNTDADIYLFYIPTNASPIGAKSRILCQILDEHPSDLTWIQPKFEVKGGDNAHRPTCNQYDVGVSYYDTGLNKPIWWTGSAWVDATGTTV